MKFPYFLVKIGLIACAIGAMLLFRSYKNHNQFRSLSESGVKTTIVVTDKFSERRVLKNSEKQRSPKYDYCIVYTFENMQGKSEQGEKCLSPERYDEFKRGDKLQMVYLPNKPDITTFDMDKKKNAGLILQSFGWPFIGFGLVMFLLQILWSLSRKRRREN